MKINRVKVSQLPSSQTLRGLLAFGIKSDGNNYKIDLGLAQDYADQAVASVVDNSPKSLNTLKKLAAAINNDPSFSTTVTQLIAAKVSFPGFSGSGTAGTASRSDHTHANLTFTGGVTGSYNGSAAKSVAIPTSLPTPQSLTFTGGVTGTWNGSAAKSVAIPTTLPASDVSAWAKATTKPSYTASEVGAVSDRAGQIVPYSTAFEAGFETGLRFKVTSDISGTFGAHPHMTFMYNAVAQRYLKLNRSGELRLGAGLDYSVGSLVYHSGNSNNESTNWSARKMNAPLGFHQESDDRKKEYLGDLKVDWEDIHAIPKRRYIRIDDEKKQEQIGTSAQALLKLFPQFVSEGDSGFYSVNYPQLAIVSLAAVCDLEKRVVELEKKMISDGNRG